MRDERLGIEMAQWLKMWWIIGCKCHGSLVVDVKAYFMVVYLVAFVLVLAHN